MTEAGWLACNDPETMLAKVRQRTRRREMLLLACACVRRLWEAIPDERLRWVVEVAELVADGQASREAACEARSQVRGLRAPPYQQDQVGGHGLTAVQQLAAVTAGNVGVRTVIGPVQQGAGYRAFHSPRYRRGLTRAAKTFPWMAGVTAEKAIQASLLRDLIRSAKAAPLDLGSFKGNRTVRHLAQAAYEERLLPSGELDPYRLTVLADALEEAGASSELVNHLRSPSPHVRGCWAVDLCLGLS